jgi:SAM-dependent methyltransferase
MSQTSQVAEHYGGYGLKERIDDVLGDVGLAEEWLSPSPLALLDKFRALGFDVTIELARAVRVLPGVQGVHVGSGLEEPSSYHATTFKCSVQGVDLNPSFVDAAKYPAKQSGLSDEVRYDCADALVFPYERKILEIAWTQHVAINIADRLGFYAEVHRVLRPGGQFAVYEIVADTREPLDFPVSRSRDPETSFLVTAEVMRTALEEVGFRVSVRTDDTEASITWPKARQDEEGPLSQRQLVLRLAMGPDWAEVVANAGRNFLEERTPAFHAVRMPFDGARSANDLDARRRLFGSMEQ